MTADTDLGAVDDGVQPGVGSSPAPVEVLGGQTTPLTAGVTHT